MKLYTSYYANYKNIPADYMCIGISQVCPFTDLNAGSFYSNFVFYKDNMLAPSRELLSGFKAGKYTSQEYKKMYVTRIFEFLEASGETLPEWVSKLEEAYAKWKGIVFLCYESPDKFCHRHIFSKLLNLYGIPCDEYGVDACNEHEHVPDASMASVELF